MNELDDQGFFLVVWGAVVAVACLVLMIFSNGCAPAGEPWPGDGRCGIVCLDPAFPVVCEVERPEGVEWTCTVDGDACKAVPGLVCTP